MSNQRFRVRGSGYTILHWMGAPVMFCRTINDNSPRPVGAGVGVIQGIDDLAPREIAFARAAKEGSLVLAVYEEWDREIWATALGWNGVAVDNAGEGDDDEYFRSRDKDTIVEILNKSAKTGGVTCEKIIRTPGRGRPHRKVIYHNCVVTDVDLGENVAIEDIEVLKTITLTYTHSTRWKGQGGN